MRLVFLQVNWLINRLDPPCATCPAEVFPARFAEMEQAVQKLLPQEGGFNVHVVRKNTEWSIVAHRGIWSGYAVICSPRSAAESFHPTEVLVRVRLDSVVLNLFVYPLLALYLLLIGLSWGDQLLGWGRLPGPGLMAFLGAVVVIVASMMMGALIGVSKKITGDFAPMMAQMAEIKQLACTVLAAGAPPSEVVRRSARRFRLILGSLLCLLGIGSIAVGCILLARHGNQALVLGGPLFLEGAIFFFLTYACWRRPAEARNPSPPFAG